MTKLTVINGREEAQREKLREDIADLARQMAANLDKLAGYAIVVWDESSNTRVSFETRGAVPGNMVPDFVRMALLRNIVKEDTKQIVAETLGYGPDTPA